MYLMMILIYEKKLYYDGEQSSFEEVAFTVSNKDEPSMDCLTFRSLFLGLVYIVGMSYLHQWTYIAVYRFYIGPFIVIISSHFIGKIPLIFKRKSFTIKENCIVFLMSNVAGCFNSQYQYSTLGLLLQMKEGQLNYVHIIFIVIDLQFVAFGFAGVFRRYLVWPSGQIWPSNMPYIQGGKSETSRVRTPIVLLLYSHRTPIVLPCTPMYSHVLPLYSYCTPTVLPCTPTVLPCTPMYSHRTPLYSHST
jgi:hypothetical protein